MKDSLAILDIGSNSVRFAILCRDINSSFSIPSGRKITCTTRLGKDLDQAGRLSGDSMDATVAACRRFYDAAVNEAVPAFAYATSAVRDALNRQEFLDSLKKACPKLGIFLLSGEEEGRLAYCGAMGGASGTLLDIGGGSVQVVTDEWASSFPTGCVRAKDVCPEDSLSRMRDSIYTWLNRRVALQGQVRAPFRGVGGTITTLAALLMGQEDYDPSRLPELLFTPQLLNSLLLHLSSMGDTERAQMPLLRRRHDVILQGGLILAWFMERLAIKSLTPTDRDGMEGFAGWLLENGYLA